jgi:hypothetical protein
MKTTIAIFLILFSISAAADEWTEADTQRQIIFTALSIVDAQYTKDIKTRPDLEEKNPILGRHPSNGRINAYFSAVIIGHAVISYALPADLRSKWQQAGILIEIAADVNNFNMGLSVGF